VTFEYRSTLETGAVDEMNLEQIMEQIRWLDLITAATVSRIVDDVGALGPNPEKLLEQDSEDKAKSEIRRVVLRD
jgi:hypothetical protein